MSLGENIHKLRTERGMTQKQLADLLFVTAQAVSRWENDEVEPNINILNAMVEIFQVSLDVIVNGESQEKVSSEVKGNNEKTVIIKETVATCHDCQKHLFEGDQINRIERKKYVGSGRQRRYVGEIVTLCEDCYQKQLQEEASKLKAQKEEELNSLKKRRKWAYAMGGLAGILFLVICIIVTIKLNLNVPIIIVSSIVSAYTGFAFIYCMIWETYVQDVFLTIANFGFVKMPGIIFSLSIEGFIGLILVKILFAIITFVLAVCAIALAAVISAVLAFFSFPFYNGKIKLKEDK